MTLSQMELAPRVWDEIADVFGCFLLRDVY